MLAHAMMPARDIRADCREKGVFVAGEAQLRGVQQHICHCHYVQAGELKDGGSDLIKGLLWTFSFQN